MVDDEAANLKLLNKLLSAEGYHHLVLIEDPREVIGHYQQAPVDLILLDINMPYMDGYQVMEALKDLGDPIPPPILVLTAQHSKEYLVRALSSGARDFVTKPFDRNELLMRVSNLLDAHLAQRMLHDQKQVLEQMVVDRTEKLTNTRLQVVQRLGRAAEYRDEETGNHILRMSHISALIAKGLGWNKADCALLLTASPMHDIGKIGIPDAILLKPGRFDADEWTIMQTHAMIGAELLTGDDSELLQMAHSIALTHHEKWDGSGYPNGLSGENIPLVGRITALADVFDALTSERPYKKAWSVEDSVNLIKESRGSHFDPQLVDLFLAGLPEVLKIRERFSE